MSTSAMPQAEQRGSLSRSISYPLPGFDLPLNFTPADRAYSSESKPIATQEVKSHREGLAHEYSDPLFSSALDCNGYLRLTPLREFTMMQLMDQLTDKPDWDTKVFDERITTKWKQEALSSAPQIDITDKMVDWCIAELQYKSRQFQETGAITVFDGDVVKSDVAIPTSLKEALRTAALKLEDVPDAHRDWHPGSEEKVLDLVHPSLYPVVYGQTRILKDSLVSLDDCIKKCGAGQVLRVPSAEEAQIMKQGWSHPNYWDPYSRKFQWLPCDVALEGGSVKITSYINNLHPIMHKLLYNIVEKIIALAIPLWNQTLTPVKTPQFRYKRIQYTCCEYDPDPEDIPEDQRPHQLPGETEDDFWSRQSDWEHDVREVVRPEPDTFRPPTSHLRQEHLDESGNLKEECQVDLMRNYAKRGLQVIVKLANIHLTPEKPEYTGGKWHVEGQMNEHICATALYYYDVDNITESYLSFRQQCDNEEAADISYEQEHHEWLEEIFGCEQNGPTIQTVGSLITKEGRLVTFPNVFQHRVLPFQLADRSKPGHRKILALFLVDPNMKIISSANVPCQQREWWAQELRERSALPNLPLELTNIIMDGVDDFPIGLDRAKELRLELMEERKGFVVRHTEAFQSEYFSLCEH